MCRAVKSQKMRRRAIRGTHFPFPWSHDLAKVSADAFKLSFELTEESKGRTKESRMGWPPRPPQNLAATPRRGGLRTRHEKPGASDWLPAKTPFGDDSAKKVFPQEARSTQIPLKAAPIFRV